MIHVQKINRAKDLELAFEIRRKVFVIEQRVDPKEEYDEFEVSSTHYLALEGHRALGTARWRKTDYGTKLERFAVLEEARSKGVGKALVLKCLEDVPKDGSPIYLHAQVQVIPFYEKLGFETIGDEFVEAEIRHKKMVYKP